MHTTILRSIALVSVTLAAAPLPAQVESITVDAAAPTQPFPHFWERMFGSGRAVLSLRESYREDLRAVRAVTAVAYVRFHAILHDEVGVYSEDSKGAPVYNFSYIDQIYDGLLANGVRPLIELGFMPRQLAGADIRQSFWYRPVVAPPKDYGRWDALIGAFAGHLVDRYGIGEVSRWYFEVWNEPNLDFWGGEPRQSTYWTLYDHTARALKAVDPRLRVGGPGVHRALRARARPGRFRLDARLRRRYRAGRLRHQRAHSSRADGVPRRAEGARGDPGFCPAVAAPHLDGVQRDLREPPGDNRRALHGAVARGDDPPM